jgi:glycosyltransferase involved in cell wall biosynthesis
MSSRPRVVLLRGHNVNVWDLRPFEALDDAYDASVLVTGSNLHNLAGMALKQVQISSPRDRIPGGRAAGAAAYALGERYLGLKAALRGADIVHAAEIGTWFTAQAAALKDELGFKLVSTVWETLPWLDTYRWPRERKYRATILPKLDLCLAATDRARNALLLEGVPDEKIEVCPPGIDLDRFATAAAAPRGDTVLSAGRLVWEKGHQDVIRAAASTGAKLLVVGDGPEGAKLRKHAAELGADVEFRSTVPYDEMPGVYASASMLVLASIPTKGWEEQFGMVLVEAMAAGTPVVAADSGAIAEVLGGQGRLVRANDWRALADAIADGPPPKPDIFRLQHFSTAAATERIRAAYGRVA